MEEGRARQSLPVNLLLSLVSIAIFLAGAETLARHYEPPPRPRLPENYTFDWAADWGDDFYVLRFPSTGWPRSEAFNRDGVRDRAHPVEKLEGVRRVVFLGDSVTLGYPGPPEEAYPRVLQSLIDARGPGVEIFNVALMAWSTRQERIAYERIARKYHPDQVVVGICLNDPQELQNNLSRPSPWVTGLFSRSALVRRIVNAEGREIDSVQRLFLEPNSWAVRAGMGRFYQELGLLRDVVRRDGVDFSAVLFPYAGQVVPDAHPPTVQEDIKAFCAREGIPVLDVLPVLRPLGPRGFTRDDHIHPTGEGYARVAAAVLEAGVVPRATYSVEALDEALAGRPPETPLLATLLDSPRAEVRRQAAWRLGRDGAAAQAAIPALTRRLKDEQPGMRWAAADVLDRIGPPARAAIPALLDELGDAHEAVRWRAAEALSSIGLAPSEWPRLAEALTHRDEYVRAFAAWSLGEMAQEGRPAANALAAAMSDPDPSVRAVVAMALAKIGASAPPVLEALERALADHSWVYRWRAARALGRVRGDPAGPVASLATALSRDDDVNVRREAARALGRYGRGAAPAIRELSDARRDSDPDVRQAAAWALETITSGAERRPPPSEGVESASGSPRR
jgi:HEAT repeat protein/lysophospholipase L1-like esterase